jgi:hypothetical protein
MVLVCRLPHHGTTKRLLLVVPEDDTKNVSLEQWAAMPPWFRDECHLPGLDDIEPSSLAYWQSRTSRSRLCHRGAVEGSDYTRETPFEDEQALRAL